METAHIRPSFGRGLLVLVGLQLPGAQDLVGSLWQRSLIWFHLLPLWNTDDMYQIAYSALGALALAVDQAERLGGTMRHVDPAPGDETEAGECAWLLAAREALKQAKEGVHAESAVAADDELSERDADDKFWANECGTL